MNKHEEEDFGDPGTPDWFHFAFDVALCFIDAMQVLMMTVLPLLVLVLVGVAGIAMFGWFGWHGLWIVPSALLGISIVCVAIKRLMKLLGWEWM